MRELNKRISSPTQSMPEPRQASGLLATQTEIISDMHNVVEQLETLTTHLCGGFPTPAGDDKFDGEGLITALHRGMKIEQELLSRIQTCINMIRSAI